MKQKTFFIVFDRPSFGGKLKFDKKSHACEEGRGTSKNFCLAFVDELEKQLFIKKTVEVG